MIFMEPFKYLKSKPVPFDIVNVDTDQIIPKQFLKLLGKTGYGKYLFYNWRYDILVLEAQENMLYGHSKISVSK